MTLKDFIKTSINDITSAIKECQDEIQNGAILCPTNVVTDNVLRSKDGDLNVSTIDFDISVTSEVVEQNENGAKLSLGIVSVIGVGIGSKTNDSGKEQSASRIKFSIPIVFPPNPVEVRERVTHKSGKGLYY